MQISITGTAYGGTGGVGGTTTGSGGGIGLVPDDATPGNTGSGSTTVDLTGEIPAESAQKFRVVPDNNIQEVQGIGATDTEFFPRGNKKLTWSFTIQREHDTAEDALYFCLSHESQFPVQGTLKVTTDAGEMSYSGAVAAVSQLEFEGATTTHAYRILSGGAGTAGTVGGGIGITPD